MKTLRCLILQNIDLENILENVDFPFRGSKNSNWIKSPNWTSVCSWYKMDFSSALFLCLGFPLQCCVFNHLLITILTRKANLQPGQSASNRRAGLELPQGAGGNQGHTEEAWRKWRLLNHLFTSSEHQWYSVNDFIDPQYCSIKCVYFDSEINMHLQKEYSPWNKL